jgi:uncharacterized protein with von Willebrand factor type A (vWA) domain
MMGKLKDLAARAGRWLGLGASAPARHTTAVVGDRFDDMTWDETYTAAASLRELGEDLAQTHHYAGDLLRDAFLAAYKAAPALRDRVDMDRSRLVNHQVIASMLAAPEFAELRRETAGDPYAAAMAVLAQAPVLRRLLEKAETAKAAADAAEQARRDAADTAQAVTTALEQASDAADLDGEVPTEQAGALEQALAAAEAAEQRAGEAGTAAEQAIDQAAPGMRAPARAAAAAAAEQARDETALMRSWGLGPGQLQRMDFDHRARLAHRLRTNRLAGFADLIGRFRTMASAERTRKTEHGVDELVGITLGDDLGRLIPSELASLGEPTLRTVFAARLAEQRLFVYETRGDESTGKGAIIACIDCSYSMNGPREAWAKACALALLDQARTAGRDFAGILFSSAGENQVFRFPGHQPPPIEDVLDFAELFYGGGTDFATPLDAAAQILDEEYTGAARQHGDIVFITDGECSVTEDWMRGWRETKTRLDFRVFGISVAQRPGPVLEALADNVRTVDDLTDPDTSRDLFRVI